MTFQTQSSPAPPPLQRAHAANYGTLDDSLARASLRFARTPLADGEVFFNSLATESCKSGAAYDMNVTDSDLADGGSNATMSTTGCEDDNPVFIGWIFFVSVAGLVLPFFLMTKVWGWFVMQSKVTVTLPVRPPTNGSSCSAFLTPFSLICGCNPLALLVHNYGGDESGGCLPCCACTGDWLLALVTIPITVPFSVCFWTLYTIWVQLRDAYRYALQGQCFGGDLEIGDITQGTRVGSDIVPPAFATVMLRLIEDPLQFIAAVLFMVYFPDKVTWINWASVTSTGLVIGATMSEVRVQVRVLFFLVLCRSPLPPPTYIIFEHASQFYDKRFSALARDGVVRSPSSPTPSFWKAVIKDSPLTVCGTFRPQMSHTWRRCTTRTATASMSTTFMARAWQYHCRRHAWSYRISRNRCGMHVRVSPDEASSCPLRQSTY